MGLLPWGLGSGAILFQSWLLYREIKKTKHLKEENQSLRETLEKSRKLDEVTGALNYPYFVKAANLLIKQARRAKDSLTMLLVDIESLERINLRYSYKNGDAILIHLYRKLSHTLQNRSIIGRFGGSGFFVLIESDDELKVMDDIKTLCQILYDDHCKIQGGSISYRTNLATVTLHGRQITLVKMLDAVEIALDNLKRVNKRCGIADGKGNLLKVG